MPFQATKNPCLSICQYRPCLLYIHISHYKLLFDIILFKSLQLIYSTLFPQTEYCMCINFPIKNLFILFKKLIIWNFTSNGISMFQILKEKDVMWIELQYWPWQYKSMDNRYNICRITITLNIILNTTKLRL